MGNELPDNVNLPPIFGRRKNKPAKKSSGNQSGSIGGIAWLIGLGPTLLAVALIGYLVVGNIKV